MTRHKTARITVQQRKSIDIPETLGEITSLFTRLVKEFGKDAILEMDAGHNNIYTVVVWQRSETPEEMATREAHEEKQRQGKMIARERRLDECRRCGHPRYFHVRTVACCGDPDGRCECIQFKEPK